MKEESTKGSLSSILFLSELTESKEGKSNGCKRNGKNSDPHNPGLQRRIVSFERTYAKPNVGCGSICRKRSDGKRTCQQVNCHDNYKNSFKN